MKTLEEVEQEYIRETKNEKPEEKNPRLITTINDYNSIKNWYQRFSLWLVEQNVRLEKNCKDVEDRLKTLNWNRKEEAHRWFNLGLRTVCALSKEDDVFKETYREEIQKEILEQDDEETL